MTKSEIIKAIIDGQEEPLDLDYLKLIRDVLKRLPENILSKLYEVMPHFFVINKDTIATVKFTLGYGEEWLILINESMILELSPEDRQSCIAEELAHVLLKHKAIDTLSGGTNPRIDKLEVEAAELVRQWGFKVWKSSH